MYARTLPKLLSSSREITQSHPRISPRKPALRGRLVFVIAPRLIYPRSFALSPRGGKFPLAAPRSCTFTSSSSSSRARGAPIIQFSVRGAAQRPRLTSSNPSYAQADGCWNAARLRGDVSGFEGEFWTGPKQFNAFTTGGVKTIFFEELVEF